MARVLSRSGAPEVANFLALPPDEGTPLVVDRASGSVYVMLTDASIARVGGQDIVSIRDKGATGNGITDDTASIQMAANAIGAAGGILLVPTPSVEYKVSSEIVISGPMIIQGPGTGAGDGSTATFRTSSATANIFRVTTPKAVVFRDIAFGASVVRTGGASIKLESNGSTVNLRSRIENCYFQGEWVCIQIDAARFWIVRDCVFDQFLDFGIFYSNTGFADQADNAVLANTFVGATGAQACFYAEQAAATWILGNKLFGAAYGVWHNAKGSTGTYQIVGNSFEQQANGHILIQQSTLGTIFGQLNINANEFSQLSFSPLNPSVYIAAGASQWAYRINICDNVFNHLYNVNLDAISVQDGDGVVVANNVIDHNGQALPGCITVGGNATNVKVLDNVCVNMTSAQRYKNGLTATTIVRDSGLLVAELGGWGNGSEIYTRDGLYGSDPLTGGDNGAFGRRVNGRWVGT